MVPDCGHRTAHSVRQSRCAIPNGVLSDPLTFARPAVLVGASQKVRDRIVQHVSEADSDSEPEYPLTPPISRPLSPEYHMTPEELGVLTVNLLQDQEVRRSKRKSVLTHRRPQSKHRPHPVVLKLTLCRQKITDIVCPVDHWLYIS